MIVPILFSPLFNVSYDALSTNLNVESAGSQASESVVKLDVINEY